LIVIIFSLAQLQTTPLQQRKKLQGSVIHQPKFIVVLSAPILVIVRTSYVSILWECIIMINHIPVNTAKKALSKETNSLGMSSKIDFTIIY
jgi:hypothetical protein